MGLDQYGYFLNKEEATNLSTLGDGSVGFKEPAELKKEDFYWRKHANLQNWAEKLYHSRGGTEEFNTVVIQLYPEDIAELKRLTKEKALPTGEGFFWGESTPEDDKETLSFCELAERCHQEGGAVLYSSWW